MGQTLSNTYISYCSPIHHKIYLRMKTKPANAAVCSILLYIARVIAGVYCSINALLHNVNAVDTLQSLKYTAVIAVHSSLLQSSLCALECEVCCICSLQCSAFVISSAVHLFSAVCCICSLQCSAFVLCSVLHLFSAVHCICSLQCIAFVLCIVRHLFSAVHCSEWGR